MTILSEFDENGKLMSSENVKFVTTDDHIKAYIAQYGIHRALGYMDACNDIRGFIDHADLNNENDPYLHTRGVNRVAGHANIMAYEFELAIAKHLKPPRKRTKRPT